jgi:hypothetical protein
MNKRKRKVHDVYADREPPESRCGTVVRAKQKKAGKQAGEKSGFRKFC